MGGYSHADYETSDDYEAEEVATGSLLANPLILPAQPAVMVLGGLSVLQGLVWLPLGRLAALLSGHFTAFTIRMVELLGRIPHGELVLGSCCCSTPSCLAARSTGRACRGCLRS